MEHSVISLGLPPIRLGFYLIARHPSPHADGRLEWTINRINPNHSGFLDLCLRPPEGKFLARNMEDIENIVRADCPRPAPDWDNLIYSYVHNSPEGGFKGMIRESEPAFCRLDEELLIKTAKDRPGQRIPFRIMADSIPAKRFQKRVLDLTETDRRFRLQDGRHIQLIVTKKDPWSEIAGFRLTGALVFGPKRKTKPYKYKPRCVRIAQVNEVAVDMSQQIRNIGFWATYPVYNSRYVAINIFVHNLSKFQSLFGAGAYRKLDSFHRLKSQWKKLQFRSSVVWGTQSRLGLAMVKWLDTELNCRKNPNPLKLVSSGKSPLYYLHKFEEYAVL